jgi:C4-dicarboxylate transporter DctM subunit
VAASAFIISLLAILAAGIPIFIALILPSMYYFIEVLDMQGFLIVQSYVGGMNKYTLLCVPFFTLAASVMGKGEIGPRLLKFAKNLVGHMHGGFALATIVTCAFVGAISGASVAGILIIGALVYKEMDANGYDSHFSAGLITSTSAVGMLIPPSICFVIYAMNTDTSVLKLFLAGVGSGLTWAIIFGSYCYFYAKNKKIPRIPRPSLKEVLMSIKEAGWALGLPFIIIGGMYSGLFSPTEAAAVSAGYAIIVEMYVYKDINIKELMVIITNCAKTCATVYILLASGQVLAYTMTLAKIPSLMAGLLGSTSQVGVLLIINLLFIIAGMFMGAGAAIVIIIPMVFQLAMSVGIDPIHLGNVITTNLAIGMSTAPFGQNLFVSCRALDMEYTDVVKSVLPFIILSLLVLALVTFIPAISLYLPSLL